MFTVLFTSIGRRVELVRALKILWNHGFKSPNFRLMPNRHSPRRLILLIDASKYPRWMMKAMSILSSICRAEKVDLLIPLRTRVFLVGSEALRVWKVRGFYYFLNDKYWKSVKISCKPIVFSLPIRLKRLKHGIKPIYLKIFLSLYSWSKEKEWVRGARKGWIL